ASTTRSSASSTSLGSLIVGGLIAPPLGLIVRIEAHALLVGSNDSLPHRSVATRGSRQSSASRIGQRRDRGATAPSNRPRLPNKRMAHRGPLNRHTGNSQ